MLFPEGTAVTATMPKARRVRAPKDLATQYGEKATRTPRVTEATARRARRDAQARERLRQIMTPDEDVMRRLSRAGAISSSLISDEEPPRRTQKPRRARQWDWRCGKCGAKDSFSTPAALCARCGAIAVRPD